MDKRALHKLMLAQAADRKACGRPLGPGDVVVDDRGGYHIIRWAKSAHDFREEDVAKGLWPSRGGSTAKDCQDTGGRRTWFGTRADKKAADGESK